MAHGARTGLGFIPSAGPYSSQRLVDEAAHQLAAGIGEKSDKRSFHFPDVGQGEKPLGKGSTTLWGG